MKKFLVAILCVFIAGCAVSSYSPPSHQLIKVTWEQKGKDCVYIEKNGKITQEWDYKEFKHKNNEYVNSVKEIKYSNTSCTKVIDAELKNKTNKSPLPNNFHELKSISETRNIQYVSPYMY